MYCQDEDEADATAAPSASWSYLRSCEPLKTPGLGLRVFGVSFEFRVKGSGAKGLALRAPHLLPERS